jgi:hypothetical protein
MLNPADWTDIDYNSDYEGCAGVFGLREKYCLAVADFGEEDFQGRRRGRVELCMVVMLPPVGRRGSSRPTCRFMWPST